MNGRDVFVCLPMGSGKSLCYCLLPKVFDNLKLCTHTDSSIVVVVSPLISLMKDQVRAMMEHNITIAVNVEKTSRFAPLWMGRLFLAFSTKYACSSS